MRRRNVSGCAVKTFKDLIVWQKAFDLSVGIYRVSCEFPKHELYGLTSELRKTSRSIAYNIAEGYKRWSTVEYIRFLRIASGSAAELETQVLLADRLGYLTSEKAAKIAERLLEVTRMLDALIRSLRTRSKAIN
ncbi:MAG: four helix bundle protein [Acidobacteria bacterium]|nr:four helix bundle protein [Acidobacteriota bacterium]